MIRNLIDYSEYRIQRSNFEFWDRLVNYSIDWKNELFRKRFNGFLETQAVLPEKLN
jgi:hypothetical protein